MRARAILGKLVIRCLTHSRSLINSCWIFKSELGFLLVQALTQVFTVWNRDVCARETEKHIVTVRAETTRTTWAYEPVQAESCVPVFEKMGRKVQTPWLPLTHRRLHGGERREWEREAPMRPGPRSTAAAAQAHGQKNTAAGHMTIMRLFKKENRPGFFCKEDSLKQEEYKIIPLLFFKWFSLSTLHT